MAHFDTLASPARLGLCAALFMAAATMLALCLTEHFALAGLRRRALDGAVFAALSLSLAYLRACGEANLSAPIPWIIVLMIAVFGTLRGIYGVLRENREMRDRLSPGSIREALDNLDTGVLYADGDGRTVLINRAMAEVLGFYPRHDSELAPILRNAAPVQGGAELVKFPDGRVFAFRTSALEGGCTAVTAGDVSELASALETLRRDNAELQKTNASLREMYDRLADRIREDETLTLKMRVHNDIGASLIAISELIDGPEEDVEAQLRKLSEAVSYFRGDIGASPETIPAAVRRAGELRVDVELRGEGPDYGEAIIAAAIHECATNCVRHGRGNRVFVEFCPEKGGFSAVFTNDGAPPREKIREGGGLGSLRRRVEGAGGSMEVASDGGFALKIFIPEVK